ncbi:hypothetical protein MKEN_01381600 [Mycena kentingensis (nom. inval.)]|nr:hypothetical protein MKEN_01381600 [Mycena kentingensis (nom. inval.)]
MEPRSAEPQFDERWWRLTFGIPQEAVDLLSANFQAMVAFVHPDWERDNVPIWEAPPDISEERRQFVSKLRIPKWNRSPSLLMHELGVYYNLDEGMEKRLQNLLRPKVLTCLVNASGSGKTRHCLEALCARWGFYFCFIKRPQDDMGSRDMCNVGVRLSEKRAFTPNLKEGHPDFLDQLHENRNLAHDCFFHVILARVLIYRMFLEAIVASGRNIVESDRRRWTLLQMNPAFLGSDCDDIFEALAQILDNPIPAGRQNIPTLRRNVTEPRYKDVLEDAWRLLKKHSSPAIKSKSRDFCFILDEAQVGAQQFNHAFRCAELTGTGKDRRPFLRELLVVLYVLLGDGCIVLTTGTGLDLDLVEEVTNSLVFKGDIEDSVTITDTGGFHADAESHQAYIAKYIPPDMLDGDLGSYLLWRMASWFSGRYRTTASFLAYFLERGLVDNNPHRWLDNWIMYNTHFIPTDSPRHESESPLEFPNDIKQDRKNTLLYQLQVNRIVARPDLYSNFVHVVYGSFLRSHVTHSVKGLARKIVECGFGPFVDPQLSIACMREPLIILAAMSQTASEAAKAAVSDPRSRHVTIPQQVENHFRVKIDDDSSKNNGFESYIALELAKAFAEPRALRDVFTFSDKFPAPWLNQKAQLVAVHCSDDDPESLSIYEVNWPGRKVPAGHLGRTCNVEETVDWLQNRDSRGAAFCFPDNNMGPDIMAKFRLEDGKLLWVLVQCKNWSAGVKRNGVPDRINEKTKEAVRKLAPGYLWIDRNDKAYASSKYPELVDKTLGALALLDEYRRSCNGKPGKGKVGQRKVTTHRQFRLIRIAAVLPHTVTLDHFKKTDLADVGKHPFGVLNWQFLKGSDPTGYWEDGEVMYDAKVDIGAGRTEVLRTDSVAVAEDTQSESERSTGSPGPARVVCGRGKRKDAARARSPSKKRKKDDDDDEMQAGPPRRSRAATSATRSKSTSRKGTTAAPRGRSTTDPRMESMAAAPQKGRAGTRGESRATDEINDLSASADRGYTAISEDEY